MVKGRYYVAPTSDPCIEQGIKSNDIKQVKKDDSYKSMICSILVFIVICLMLIIITFPYKFKNKVTHQETKNDPSSFEKIYYNSNKIPLESTTKYVIQDTTVYEAQIPNFTFPIPEDNNPKEFTSEKTVELTPNLPQDQQTDMIEQDENDDISDEEDYKVDKTTHSYSKTPTEQTISTDSQELNDTIKVENVTPESDLVELIDLCEDDGCTKRTFDEWEDDRDKDRSAEKTTTTKRSFTKGGIKGARKGKILKYIQETTTPETTTPETTTPETTTSETTTPETTVSITTEIVTEISNFKVDQVTEVSTPRYEETTISSKENKESSIKSLSLFGERKSLNAHVCQDTECKFISARILSKINHVIDPCEDFYDYACGNYNTDNAEQVIFEKIIQEIDSSNEKSPKYLKDFKIFYDNCVNYHENFDYNKRLSTAKEIFNSVSKLYEPQEHLPHEMNTTELIYKFFSLEFSPVFDINVDIDRGTKNFVFQINLGKLDFTKQQQNCFKNEMKKYVNSGNINLTKVYSDYIECQDNLTDYLDNVDKALVNFEAFSKLNEQEKKKERQSLRNIIEFDILNSLKKIPSPGFIKQTIIKKKYKVAKLSDLEAKYPFIQWCKLFSKLHGEWIDNKQRVQVYFEEEYFDHILKQLDDIPPLKRHNALMAMFAEHLYTTFVQPKNIENPSKYCVKQATNLLKRESTAIYLDSFKSSSEISSTAKTISEIFEDLKSILSAMINATEWLDSKSEDAIKKKIHKIDIVTENMLDTFKNDSFMNSTLEIFNDNSTYQNLVIEILKRNQKIKFGLWNQSSTNLDNIWWHYVPNFYSKPKSLYITGIILVPLHTLLKLPKNLPKYLQLASVDYPIAREIGHQFDSIGITYPLNPEINSLLTKDTIPTYHEMKNCGTDKYSYELSHNMNGKNYGYMINADLSLDERIAEDIALKLIDHTSEFVENEPLLPFMSNSFSREKTLYLVLAQYHCKRTSIMDFITGLFENEKLTPALMLKSFFGNSEKFPQTFQCKEGSGMHHPIKCRQFPDLLPPEYPEYTLTN